MSLIPRWLRENLRIKIGLLILATTLWFLVVTQQTYEYTLDVPIIVNELQPGKLLASALPSQAQVRIQGTGRELLRLIFFNPPTLILNLSKVSAGQKLDLHPEMVAMPGGMNASAIEVSFPDSLEIDLETRLEVELPVKLCANFNTAAGYVIFGEPRLHPDKIIIIGPYSALHRLSYIETLPIVVSNLRRNTEVRAELKTIPGYSLSYSASSVTALINVERLVERPLVGIAVRVINLPPGREAELEPSVVDVKVSGPFGLVGEVKFEDVDAWVDYSEFIPIKSNRVPVHTRIESPLEVSQITPSELRLTIRRQ